MKRRTLLKNTLLAVTAPLALPFMKKDEGFLELDGLQGGSPEGSRLGRPYSGKETTVRFLDKEPQVFTHHKVGSIQNIHYYNYDIYCPACHANMLKRVWHVDCGKLSKAESEKYLRSIIKKFREKREFVGVLV